MTSGNERACRVSLSGLVGGWDESRVAALGKRYAGPVEVHSLTMDAAPGALHDSEALVRLGVEGAA